jgi:hypothetical protein
MNKEKPLYRILDLSPKSNWLILFFIPPFFIIYFLAVGSYLLEKRGKKNLIFQVVIGFLLMLFCFMIVSEAFFPGKLSKSTEMGLAATGVLSWVTAIVILTIITVKYERSLKPDHHFTFADNFEYVKRYFCFAYFPFSIWSFQYLANEYRKPREEGIERACLPKEGPRDCRQG